MLQKKVIKLRKHHKILNMLLLNFKNLIYKIITIKSHASDSQKNFLAEGKHFQSIYLKNLHMHA